MCLESHTQRQRQGDQFTVIRSMPCSRSAQADQTTQTNNNKTRIVLPKLGTDTKEWTSREQGCLSLSCPRPEPRIEQLMGWGLQQWESGQCALRKAQVSRESLDGLCLLGDSGMVVFTLFTVQAHVSHRAPVSNHTQSHLETQLVL